jgi:hypothetical protein
MTLHSVTFFLAVCRISSILSVRTSLTWSLARLPHRLSVVLSQRSAGLLSWGLSVMAGAACVVWSGCDVRQAGAGLAKDLMSCLADGWIRTPPRAGPFLRRSRDGPARLGGHGGWVGAALSGPDGMETRVSPSSRAGVSRGCARPRCA